MKHLLPLLLFLASCGPSRYIECPKYVGVVVDTIPEYEHSIFTPIATRSWAYRMETSLQVKDTAARLWSWVVGPQEYYFEAHDRENDIYRRPIHCIVASDTLKVMTEQFFDSLFTKAKVIQAGGKVFIEEIPMTAFHIRYGNGFHSDTLVYGGGILALPVAKPDTLCEWMHISMTRGKGFVVARKALCVRIGDHCTAHLDCSGKPFPAHYHVGWCQGKEELLNRLVKGRGR